MPTHWESSKRPLYVRTVVVNGSRHAILSEEDPLCPNAANTNKPSRPDSSQSSQSSYGSEITHNGGKEHEKDAISEKGGKKDLQSCLVKLRLVLTSQENRKTTKVDKKQIIQAANKKKRKSCTAEENGKTCEWHAIESPKQNIETDSTEVRSIKYDPSHNVAVASFFNSEPRLSCCHQSQDNDIERIVGHTEFPNIEYNYPFSSNVSAISTALEYDIPWNRIPSDSYFTRPFYNKLSERVMQWLDLSSRKIRPPESDKRTEVKTYNKRRHSKALKKFPRDYGSSEDNSDEVRTDEDVETVLSKEYPKFSQELNRLHQLKSTIPVKEETLTTQLQESITHSFKAAGSTGKLIDFSKPKLSPTKILRKGYLTKQIRLDETSEEEEETKSRKQWRFNSRNDLVYAKNVLSCLQKVSKQERGPCSKSVPEPPQSKVQWMRDCKWPTGDDVTKPQLHIFMPPLPDCELLSDSASISSDS